MLHFDASKLAIFAAVCLLGIDGTSQAAVTYTYTDSLVAVVPLGTSTTLTVEFTTAEPLSPATAYTELPADTLTSNLTVSSTYPLGNFTLPVKIFQLDTNSAGTITDWYIWSDMNNLVGGPPIWTGRDTNAYTESYVDNDQATIVDYYASCAGVPGCTDYGQPHVFRFAAQTMPSLGTWTVTAVPEPSTWAMLLLGFAGLGFAGYRQARVA